MRSATLMWQSSHCQMETLPITCSRWLQQWNHWLYLITFTRFETGPDYAWEGIPGWEIWWNDFTQWPRLAIPSPILPSLFNHQRDTPLNITQRKQYRQWHDGVFWGAYSNMRYFTDLRRLSNPLMSLKKLLQNIFFTTTTNELRQN